jgi:hypothetical protein
MRTVHRWFALVDVNVHQVRCICCDNEAVVTTTSIGWYDYNIAKKK